MIRFSSTFGGEFDDAFPRPANLGGQTGGSKGDILRAIRAAGANMRARVDEPFDLLLDEEAGAAELLAADDALNLYTLKILTPGPRPSSVLAESVCQEMLQAAVCDGLALDALTADT